MSQIACSCRFRLPTWHSLTVIEQFKPIIQVSSMYNIYHQQCDKIELVFAWVTTGLSIWGAFTLVFLVCLGVFYPGIGCQNELGQKICSENILKLHSKITKSTKK